MLRKYLFQKPWTRKNRPSSRQFRRRSFVESLEQRCLMTADLGGNTIGAATNLGSLEGSREVSDFVGRADLNDYYRVQLGRQSELRLNLNGLRADADLELIDSNHRVIANSVRGSTNSESITRVLNAGTYYFRVYRYSGDTNYRLTMAATAQANTPPDNAGNSLGSARSLGALSGERSYSDFVGSADTNDYYRFELSGRSAFQLSLDGLAADADVALLDQNGGTIASSTRGSNDSESISRTLDPGTYFIHVYRYSGDTNYRLTLRAEPQGPADGAGNSWGAARDLGTLSGALTFNDFVGQADNADYYRFHLSSRSTFHLRMDGMTADADVMLLRANGSYVAGSFRGGMDPEAVDQVLESGDYVAFVYPYGNANTNYRLQLEAQAASREGWASATGFRFADTSVQLGAVQRALNQVGQASPASRLAHSGGSWQTDVADGDGQRIRNAFAVYGQWRTLNPGANPPADVLGRMHNALSATYQHAGQRTELVNRIAATYDNRRARGLAPAPQDDQQVLDYLEIRQQCVEWANASVGMAAGGSYRGYNSPALSDVTQVRPGMALRHGTSHFMVITDVFWNTNGQPTRVRVAESNYGAAWSNPLGQRPWERTIGSREINVEGLLGSEYNVVSFG